MVIALATKPGINGANTLSIPKDWDATWFRKFIANSLKGADVRNAIAGPGISITGTIASPYATISAIGGGSALPGTISDLVCWFEFDNILASAGKVQFFLFDRTPWAPNSRGINTLSNVVIGPSLNSLTTLLWPSAISTTGSMTLSPTIIMNGGGTYFIVMNPHNAGSTQAIIGAGASAHALALYAGAGTGAIALVDGLTAVMGTCSTTWTAGIPFQANVTYNASTGAWAFRQARAAANSGTYGTGIGSTPLTVFGSDNGGAFLDGDAIAAFIAYNRVLSPTEIAAVESYLFAKWGV